MDADPWADTPPSPRPRTLPGTPAKATTQSPLTQSSARFDTAPQPTASSSSPPPIKPPEATSGDEFDEFDNFDAARPEGAVAAALEGAEDDGFGDFGDFEEGDFANVEHDQPATTVREKDVPTGNDLGQDRWVS